MKYELKQDATTKNLLSLTINTEVEYLQNYNSTSFILSYNGDYINFLVEIISPTEITLNFIDVVNYPYIIIESNLQKLGEPLEKFVQIVNSITPIIEPVEVIHDCLINFYTGGFKINSSTFTDIAKQTITIEKYDLENYSDFPNESIIIKSDMSQTYLFDFASDYVYNIKIQYESFAKEFGYIYNKPTIYYSSLYHISKMSEKYAIKIKENESERFDLKLFIWRESKIALEIAGVSSDRVSIINNESSVINKYVTLKILSMILARNILDYSIKKDLSDVSSASDAAANKVQLGDFAIGNEAISVGLDDIIKSFQEINKDLKSVESILRTAYSHLLSDHKIVINKQSRLKRSEMFGGYKV